MSRSWLIATASILLLLAPSAAAAPSKEDVAPPHAQEQFKPGTLLVKFKPEATLAGRQAALAASQAIAGTQLLVGGPRRVAVQRGRELEKLAEVSANPAVEYAELDYVASARWTPNDPQYSDGTQWGLQRIDAAGAWDRTRGEGVTVAVIDTGVDLGHPDLAANLVAGYDFVNDTTIPSDDNGHGTHVAGIIAALGNNANGGLGIAPGAKVMPLKALGADGNGYYSDIVQAIRYAADRGVRVINMSFGGSNDSRSLRDAVDYGFKKGALMVAAAGNDASNVAEYPAAYGNVLAVAATNRSDQKASFSDYGSFVSLAAPGVNIYSTLPRSIAGGYGYLSGTSMAAPFVSGVGALAFAAGACQDAGNVAIRQAIENGTDDIDALNPNYAGQLGHGRLDAARSLLAPPVLSASAGRILVIAETGATAMQRRTLDFSTGQCSAPLVAQVESGATWLTAKVTASEPQVTIIVDPAGLAAGHYSANVTVGYPYASSPRVVMPAELIVTPQVLRASVAGVDKQAP